MKNYREELNELYNNAISELKKALEIQSVVELFDFENEDWEDSENFHDLPQEIVFTDPMYDVYYLHKVYLEDNTINVRGFAPEHEEHYDFTIEEIHKGLMLTIVDEVLDIVYNN